MPLLPNTGTQKRVKRLSDNSRPRQLKSCSRCRKHKTKCDFVDTRPHPCTSCAKKGIECELEVVIPVKRSNILKSLNENIEQLKNSVEFLAHKEITLKQMLSDRGIEVYGLVDVDNRYPYLPTPEECESDVKDDSEIDIKDNREIEIVKIEAQPLPIPALANEVVVEFPSVTETTNEMSVFTVPKHQLVFNFSDIKAFLTCFNSELLPYVPIINPVRSPTKLYHKSKLLFWTIVAISLPRNDAQLYLKLSQYVKELVIEECWLNTPRSICVIESLLFLSIWPLADDDASFRYVELAKSLCLQLGINRGSKFLNEFSRNKDIEFIKYGPGECKEEVLRSRIWCYIYIINHHWCAHLGIPCYHQLDYLMETSLDGGVVETFLSISILYSKMIDQLGKNYQSSNGLVGAPAFETSIYTWEALLLQRESEILRKVSPCMHKVAKVQLNWCFLLLCVFTFFPGVSRDFQIKYVNLAVERSIEIVSLSADLLKNRNVLHLPIFIRHACELSSFICVRAQMTPFVQKELVVPLHDCIERFYSILTTFPTPDWLNVETDVSKAAGIIRKVQNLNPSLSPSSLVTKGTSHLTAALFYELLWCIYTRDTCKDELKLTVDNLVNSDLIDSAKSEQENIEIVNKMLQEIHRA